MSYLSLFAHLSPKYYVILYVYVYIYIYSIYILQLPVYFLLEHDLSSDVAPHSGFGFTITLVANEANVQDLYNLYRKTRILLSILHSATENHSSSSALPVGRAVLGGSNHCGMFLLQPPRHAQQKPCTGAARARAGVLARIQEAQGLLGCCLDQMHPAVSRNTHEHMENHAKSSIHTKVI